MADVGDLDGHIACSSSTRSELVLPVWNLRGDLLGVFHIDSNQPHSCSGRDTDVLQALLRDVFEGTVSLDPPYGAAPAAHFLPDIAPAAPR